MDISVIIVNWHSAHFLNDCLLALRRALRGLDAEVIVIDNASHDGSDRVISDVYPSAIFVQSDANLGFAGANNMAARHARGRYFLFLNPDTVVEENAIHLLVAAMDMTPRAGIAGPRVLNGDGTLQMSCVQSFPTVLNQILDAELLRRRWPRSRLWGTAALIDKPGEPVAVQAIAGSCLLIRRVLFERLGGFEASYFMYGEDMDLCFRTLKLGWDCIHVPRAEIVHFGGGSSISRGSRFSVVTMRQSIYQFMLKHHGAKQAACYRLSLGLVSGPRLTAAILTAPFRWSHSIQTIRKWYWIGLWSLGLSRGYAGRG